MKSRRRRRPRPPRRTRARRVLWVALVAAIAWHYTPPRVLIALGLVIGASGLSFTVYRVRRWLRVRRRLAAAGVSLRKADYLFDDADFERQNHREGAYRRAMQLTLLETFGNACAKCGARDDGVDLDHFFWPKSAGGNFIMRHADGHLVNNAIPLCVFCNRSKSNRDHRAFFRPAQLAIVLEKNARMTRLLNAHPPLDARGRARARSRRAVA